MSEHLPPPMQLRADDVALHVSIRQHNARDSVRDHPSLVECDDAWRVTFNDLHVVLDKKHGRAFCGDCLHHEIHQLQFFIRTDAACRLVK